MAEGTDGQVLVPQKGGIEGADAGLAIGFGPLDFRVLHVGDGLDAEAARLTDPGEGFGAAVSLPRGFDVDAGFGAFIKDPVGEAAADEVLVVGEGDLGSAEELGGVIVAAQ